MKQTFIKIIQHYIDHYGDPWEVIIMTIAEEFRYLVDDYEFTEEGVIIFSDDKRYRFKKSEFNYDPLHV